MVEIDPIDPNVAPSYVPEGFIERELFARFAEADRLGTGESIRESTLERAAAGPDGAGIDGDLPERPWILLGLKTALARAMGRGVYDYGFTGRRDLAVHYTGNTDYPVLLFTDPEPSTPHLRVLRTLAASKSDAPAGFTRYVDYATLAEETGISPDNPEVVAAIAEDLATCGAVTARETDARLTPHSADGAWTALTQYGAVDR
jgi:hypothetical protein